jgi:hypothetical protein
LNKIKEPALNETRNVDLTIEREDRKTNKRRRISFNQNGIEIKPYCYEIQDTHTETLKKY